MGDDAVNVRIHPRSGSHPKPDLAEPVEALFCSLNWLKEGKGFHKLSQVGRRSIGFGMPT